MKTQAPGFIIDGKSVTWEVKMKAYRCSHLDFEWCNLEKKDCCWNICPLKVKNSFEERRK
jgi:hypothetical protein